MGSGLDTTVVLPEDNVLLCCLWRGIHTWNVEKKGLSFHLNWEVSFLIGMKYKSGRKRTVPDDRLKIVFFHGGI